MYSADVAQVSVIICLFIVLNLHLQCLCAELGVTERGGLNTVLVSVENWWYIYCIFLLLISLLIRNVAEMEEVLFWKSGKILPPSVFLACKEVEQIACILTSVWAS